MFWDSKNPNFGTLIWESHGKVTFGCSLHGEAQNIPLGCLIVVTFPFNEPHVTRLKNVELVFISQFLVGY